jgi:hypothetical protein
MVRRRRTIHLVACLASLAVAHPSLAQQAREPIGRFVVDVRGTSSGLPAEVGWTPSVPSSTELPSRGFGLDLGAHVFVIRFKRTVFGVGGTWDIARGQTSPPESTAPTTVVIPKVTTRVMTVAPQISLNFGHRLGWSYLSGGLGRTRVRSEAEAPTSGTLQYLPRESDWTKTLHYGGGARWFVNDHLGVSFDLRWYKLSIVPPSGSDPGAPRASLLTAAVGISLK